MEVNEKVGRVDQTLTHWVILALHGAEFAPEEVSTV